MTSAGRLAILGLVVGASGCAYWHKPLVRHETSQCFNLDRRPLTRHEIRVPLVKGIDAVGQCLYTQQLRAMGEPYIPDLPLSGGEQIVRFTYLRSFHPGLGVRIERRTSGTTLFATALDGSGDAPGWAHRRVRRPLDSGEWEELARAMERAQFWDHPTAELEDPNVIHLDGSQWIFEARASNRYHIVDRGSWAVLDPLRDLGLLMLRLAGLTPDEIYE